MRPAPAGGGCPFGAPDTRHLPGVLQVQQIDGLTHLTVFDQQEDCGARLTLMGARSVHSMPVGLDRAVNGFHLPDRARTLAHQR